MSAGWEAVIGLEVHVELLTSSKMFCGCATAFGAPPNTQACPVCLGMPGVLPMLNRRAVELGIRTALACGAEVSGRCRFARKNYFYPDLPKNYQISQYAEPLARGGAVPVGARSVRLTRIHLEEDAGKLVHAGSAAGASLVDCNRAGIPLMEIVTEPDIRCPDEAGEFLETLKQVLEYLGVSDCVMEEGSLRCDANISLRRAGDTGLGVKTEVKNLNSFRAVRRALAHEAARQESLLSSGTPVAQETRLWDETLGATAPMRGKEEAHDYRYFPEPDLVPVVVCREWLDAVRATVGELPGDRRRRFEESYGLSPYDARVLTAARDAADYFEACVSRFAGPKAVANWVMGELAALLKERGAGYAASPVPPSALADLVRLVAEKRVTPTAAKEALREAFASGKEPLAVVAERDLAATQDEDAVERAVAAAFAANPQAVADFRAGKRQAAGFLVGQVMRSTRGKAPAALVRRLVEEGLAKQVKEG